MSHFFAIAVLFAASVSAQNCYSPSDCAPPAQCTSLKDGIVPGTCVGGTLHVGIKKKEEPAPVPPVVPVMEKAKPKPVVRVPTSSSSSSSSSVASAAAESSSSADAWGFAKPLIDPSAIATPLTFSADPAVVSSNLFLALLTALAFLLLAGPLGAAMLIAPQSLKTFFRRLPISMIVFLVIAFVARFLLPTASAQGFVRALPDPAVLVPMYGVFFFLVAGVTNVVFNNMLTAEAGMLERFVLPAKAASGAWKKSAVAIVLSTLAFAVVGAHVASGFSLVPVGQPGAAILALVAVVVAAYSKDGLRYLLAKNRRWDPSFEANVLGIVLAAFSVWLTRSLELSPGYVFGVPVGLVIGAQLDRDREGWFELSGLGAMLACAFAAWMLLLAVPPQSASQNFLTFLVVMLVEGAFFESLPHRYLAGGPVYRWKKWAWGALCAVTTFLCLHLLWNTSSTVATLEQSPPAVTYVCILGFYVGAAVCLIAYCNRRRGATLHP